MNPALSTPPRVGRYPLRPGFKGLAETSPDAAAGVAPTAATWRDKAMVAYRLRFPSGYTAEELAAVIGCERVTAQPRVSELLALGKVVDSGERRRNGSGKRAVVWVAVPDEGSGDAKQS